MLHVTKIPEISLDPWSKHTQHATQHTEGICRHLAAHFLPIRTGLRAETVLPRAPNNGQRTREEPEPTWHDKLPPTDITAASFFT